MTVPLVRIALLLLLAALVACSRYETDAAGSSASPAGGRAGFYGAASGGL